MRTLLEFVLGPPLPTARLETERLNKTRALAALAPDALSSLAYANQEIYLGLAVAGAAGLAFSIPVAVAITGLLAILAMSYSQTLWAYPGGGGSYSVARENLGTSPGLVAAGALLIDYVLTSAVSLTAGVEALASAFPGLLPHRVVLALALLTLITIANLRGLRESATFMAVPVYLFLAVVGLMLVAGVVAVGEAGWRAVPALPAASQPVTAFLVLHTFAAGCTALTGIEAISNGISVFRPPESRNASRTLWAMAILMGVLFLGTVAQTQILGVSPQAGETILSALARRVFGSGPAYLLAQGSTLLILAVAANTSFAGFPRVASVLARDRYLPYQFAHLGDRLVFSNGILALSVLTAVLIVGFGGDSHSLIPLFAVGVFLAFTLSQAGMVVHWWRLRGPGFRAKMSANGLGALVTTITFLIVAVSKFVEGAWLVLVLIPGIGLTFGWIRRHYRGVARELSLGGLPPSLRPLPKPRLVIPISGVHRGVIEAVRYAQSLGDRITAVFVEAEPGTADKVVREWKRWETGIPLRVVPSPYRSVIGPLLDFLDEEDIRHNDGQQATVVLPEFVPARWWQALLHNQTAFLLKLALIYRRRRLGHPRAVIEVPYYLRD